MNRLRWLCVSLLCVACGGASSSDDPTPPASSPSDGGSGGAAEVPVVTEPSAAGVASESGGASGEDAPGGAGGVSDGGTGAEIAGGAAQGGAGGADDPPESCPLPPTCSAAGPSVGAKRAWRHSGPIGSANHRARDSFFVEGERQWVLGNFQYGVALLEGALRDEEVDIYLLRDCGDSWEKLGTALTSDAAKHAEVEGVPDYAGRLYFEIPKAKRLGPGRHRLRLVVAGDLTAVDAYVEIVAAGAPIVVSDVDGTLTTSENAEALALLTGSLPQANVGAALVLSKLVSKGYRVMYLTARPEWLVEKSRAFLSERGFPPGILHTTLTAFGATGDAAAAFKSTELSRLLDKGLDIQFGFGNTSSDADAYESAQILPLSQRIFFQYTDEAWDGRRIEAYGALLPELAQLDLVCEP